MSKPKEYHCRECGNEVVIQPVGINYPKEVECDKCGKMTMEPKK